MPSGRLTDYTDDLAITICERISSGESVASICRDENMPDKATVFRWLAKHDFFRDKYVQARQHQAEYWAEEILDIADDGTNDYVMRANADGSAYEVLNGEHIQRSRLRVDTRKWLMSKLKPKSYGDKMEMEHTGNLTVELVKFSGDDTDSE